MGNLAELLKYVRSGTAEGDKPFLPEVFVTPSQFEQLCGIELGSMRLLVGNKGMGKTAVVEWIARASKRRNIPCVLLRPDDISHTLPPPDADIGALKRIYFQVLVKAIAAQVGAQLSGLLTGSKATLHAEARKAGLTDDDAVQKSLALLTAIAAPTANINGVQLARDLLGAAETPALVRALNTQLLIGNLFLLLIDDTDQVASPGTPSHLNRIWALLLAVRKLANDCPAVRGLVTLRSEVWARLTSESQGQRDQTDHLRGLVVALKAEESLMKSIVEKRLRRAALVTTPRVTDPYGEFFKADQVTLPGSTEVRTWDDFIVKSARDRPRDALQLLKNMADEALAASQLKIGSDEAARAMKVYSAERVDDVTNEFALDCPSIREVINTFVDVDFESSFEDLRSHIKNTVASSTRTIIRGKTIQQQSDDDAIAVLALLHEVGFINPRVVDNRQPRGFRHVLFLENPHFVKVSNWNDMQVATWEIHPAFRTYLIGAKRDQLARVMRPTPKP